MIFKLASALFIVLHSINGFAESSEATRLGKATEDYARCADSALANFSSEKEGQKAIAYFYKAMINNIQKIVELEISDNSLNAKFFTEVMGKEVFTGYLLKGFSGGNEKYKSEKLELSNKYNHDWERVDKELWSKNGCNAIYKSINK